MPNRSRIRRPGRGSATTLLFVFIIAASAGPAFGQAQSVQRIDAESLCADCRIEVRQGPLLGRLSDDEWLGDLVSELAVTRNGRFLVAGASTLDGILIYGPDGGLDSSILRPGSGPGEFRHVTGVKAMPADSIMVLQIGRATVLGPDGSYVRSTRTGPLQAAHAVTPRPDGTIVYGSWMRTTDAAGFQYHVMDADFEVIRSFAGVPPELQLNCSRCAVHSTAWSAARPGYFWALAPNRYEIELWHESGRLARRFIIDDGWFEPWNEDQGSGEPGPVRPDAPRGVEPRPNPRLTSITEDAEGLLWVTAYVATANWSPPPPTLPRMISPQDSESLRALGEHRRKSFDTMIEVIDPERGIVLARTRIEGVAMRPAGGGMYWRTEPAPSGLVQIRTWQASLTRDRPAPAGR
jgi:hypothetical protein